MQHSNRSILLRLASWLAYVWVAGWGLLAEADKPLLFIVTNPPIMPLLGLIAKQLRNQRYIILYYDIYPDMLIRFAGLPDQSFIAQAWRYLNHQVIRHANSVVTISPQLAMRLTKHCSHTLNLPKIEIVPTWVNTDVIRPIPKAQNWFARKYGQVDKLTVLYSGNLGTVHDLTMLPEIAFRLQNYIDIHFLVIGEGRGRESLEAKCLELGLENLTFLPLQNEESLPFILATGDLGIVSLAAGAEGISMPSKTYYSMAAGSALFGLSSSGSEIAETIRQHQCGVNVVPGDIDGATSAILEMRANSTLLQNYREHARRAAEQYFAASVCIPQMLEIIERQL